jgi:hypothetical protein
MSLEIFNRDYAPLLTLIFSGANFVALFLLYYQIRLTRKWNLLQSKYNFIDTTEAPSLEKAMLNALGSLDVRLYNRHFLPLQPHEVEIIYENVEATVCLNHFINDLQNLCASYNYGIINTRVFMSIHVGRVRWWYHILHPYVKRMRQDLQDNNLWLDFEAVGKTGQFEDRQASSQPA